MRSNLQNPRRSEPGKLTAAQRREQATQDLFTELVAKEMQLQRTLWLVLRTSEKPTITVDQKEMSLLWDLQYASVPGEPTKVTLTASLLPEATDVQIANLKTLLVDTADPLETLQKDSRVGLPHHPVGYLQGRLLEGEDGIVWKDDVKKWVRRQSPQPGTAPTHAV